MLLAAHGHGVGALEQGAGGLVDGGEPGAGVHLGAVGVGGAALLEHLTGVGVHEERLGGLGGGVDAEDERCHQGILRDETGTGRGEAVRVPCDVVHWASHDGSTARNGVHGRDRRDRTARRTGVRRGGPA